MPSFKVAHINRGGVDLIIVPLNRSFGSKMRSDQHAMVNEIEQRAHAAGLKGTVIPVWPAINGTRFLAPPAWHPFFKSLSWNDVLRHINRKLSW